MIPNKKMLFSFLFILLLTTSVVAQMDKIDTRTGHTANVNAVAFSPDGKLLASGSDDKTIKIWNVATGKEERTINTDMSIYSLAFSPDGKMLVSGEMPITFWETQTGKKIRSFDSYDSCDSISFSADSKLILCGESEVKLFYTDTGEEALTISGAKAPALFIAKDKKIISASGGDLIRIWDAGTGKRLQTIEDVGEVKHLAVSPDGSFMAFINDDFEANDEDRIQLYNLLPGRRIPVSKSKVKKGDEDDLERDGRAGSVAFSPNGKFLAIGYSSTALKASFIRLVNPLTGTTTTEMTDEINNNEPEWNQLTYYTKKDTAGKLIVFSPDGATIASVADSDKAIHLWNVTTRKLQHHLKGHSINIDAIAFSEDSKRLLSVTDEGALLWWDVKTQKLEKLFSIPIDRYLDFDLSSDAKLITYRATITEIRFYDTDAGKNLRSFPLSLYGESALSPDKKIIAGSGSDYIKLFDANTGSELRTITWAKSGGILLSRLAFNPTGKMLAGRSNKWIKIWDVATGKEMVSFDSSDSGGAMVFNPKKEILAFTATSKDYSNKSVKLIDLGTGKEISSFPTSGDEVVFSLDGNLVAVVSKDDDSITFFDITTNKEVKRISLSERGNKSDLIPIGFNAEIKKLSFSPDGKYLAIATTKGVRLFDLATGKELSRLV